MSQTIVNRINLSKDGSFMDRQDLVYYVASNEKIRISLASKKFREKLPVLISNLDNKKKSRSKFLNLVEIKHPCKMSRAEFQEKYDSYMGTFNEEGIWNCEVTFKEPGSYFLQIIFISLEDFNKINVINISEFGRPEWIVVEPQLSISGTPITTKQLIMQTLLSRCVGPIDRWEELIRNQTSIGYNCFHLTPIQKVGKSGSLYSLNDQLEISKEIIPKATNRDEAHKLLKAKITDLEKKYKCLFFSEIVLNHTSYDSEWLADCPNACYNLQNTPQLTSAYELDNALFQFSQRIVKGEIQEYKKTTIENQDDLNLIMDLIEKKVIPPLNLHEYFLVDIPLHKTLLLQYITKTYPELNVPEKYFEDEEDMFNIFKPDKLHTLIDILENCLGNLGAKKNGVEVDLKAVGKYYFENQGKGSLEQFELALKKVNAKNEEKARGYLKEAVNSIRNNIAYAKLDCKEYNITLTKHLVEPYFGKLSDGTVVANNGWIFNGNQTEDFATSNNFHYLRRNLVIWGDLIKLRYGESKKDCPALWKRMKYYVKNSAEIFHGMRLDNAHATPIHVAEYFVRKARKSNPNIYIFSELFTGSQELDALYSKRIGVNALVREGAMHWSTSDLCRAIHDLSQGSDVAVGSLDPYFEYDKSNKETFHILKPRNPDALFFDLTHDNKSYYQNRTIPHSLSTAALVTMSNCFIASTKGFDEFYAENPSVVSERRHYPLSISKGKDQEHVSFEAKLNYYENPNANSVEVRGSWDDWKDSIVLQKDTKGIFRGIVNLCSGTHFFKFIVDGIWLCDNTKALVSENGNLNNVIRIPKGYKIYPNIVQARGILNSIHKKISTRYPEFYLNQLGEDIVAINRENVRKTKSYVLITRSAFKLGSEDVDVSVSLPGTIANFKLVCYMDTSLTPASSKDGELSGLESNVYIEEDLQRFADILLDPVTKTNNLKFFRMPPGFTCIIKVILNLEQMTAVKNLDESWLVDRNKLSKELVSHLEPCQLNFLLFSTENEEREKMNGVRGCYHIDGKPLVYAGFAAFSKILRECRFYNVLSHPLFENLRKGNWLMDFLETRLEGKSYFDAFTEWLRKNFGYVKALPRHLIPKYFTRIVTIILEICQIRMFQTQQLDPEIQNHVFFTRLIQSTYAFLGDVPSSKFRDFSHTLAAGLPHFVTGWTRCWGRDTFISFKGALLIPGMLKEAKEIILMFAATLRHGLIPNLLDGGNNPRYNSRDAVWWFVRAIFEYIEFIKDPSILKTELRMIFLSNSQEEHESKLNGGDIKIMTLADVVQDIFQSHAKGIKYREWNAGPKIDGQMQYEGFNVELHLDELTGFVFGGNPSNCLTWMDKMGSSKKAENAGIPATPRDGAPIEMTAILKCCLDHVARLNEKGVYPHKSIKTKSGVELTFKDWSARIQQYFEYSYWVPSDPEHFKNYSVNQMAVRRKGVYKDTFRSHRESNDYLLRPNVCIAMSLAPELFSPERACKHLLLAEKFSIKENSLGLKTLDPKEKLYIPFYNNSDDSNNHLYAHGFSYHNGPEWGWLYGFFLIAQLKFQLKDKNMTVFMSYLTNHKFFMESNDWESLPELTNDDGQYCEHSCNAQTWSIATLIESIYEAKEILKPKQQSA